MSPTKQLSPLVEWMYDVSRASTASQFSVFTCTMQLWKSIVAAFCTFNVWLESGSVTITQTGHFFGTSVAVEVADTFMVVTPNTFTKEALTEAEPFSVRVFVAASYWAVTCVPVASGRLNDAVNKFDAV